MSMAESQEIMKGGEKPTTFTYDEANEKMISLVEKKWYENTYLWLALGFVLGKI
jgi:hypothetical protein